MSAPTLPRAPAMCGWRTTDESTWRPVSGAPCDPTTAEYEAAMGRAVVSIKSAGGKLTLHVRAVR